MIRKLLGSGIVLTVLTCFPATSSAQPTLSSWANVGSDWNTGTNWLDSNVPPTTAFVSFTQTGTSSINPSLGTTNQVVSGVVFNPNVLGTGYTLSSSGGTLTVNNPNTAPFQSMPGGLVASGATHTLSNVAFTLQGGPFNTGLQVTSSGRLVLGAGTSITYSTMAQFTELRGAGATLVFDASSGGPVPTLTQLGQNIRFNGGGRLEFLGSNTGTAFGGLPDLSSGPGDAVVIVNQPGNAAVTVNALSLTRFSAFGYYTFGSTGTGTLGAGGTNPAITFTTAPTTSNGVITSAQPTADTPFAVYLTSTGSGPVTGTWAGYDATNGVTAAPATTRNSSSLGSATSTENTNFQPNMPTTTLSAPLSIFTTTISPTTNNQSLAMGTHDFSTRGIILSGSRDFTITSTGGFLFGTTNEARQIIVLDPNAALITNARLNGNDSTTIFTKGGPGFVILTNTTDDQLSFPIATTNVGIAGGTLRIPSTFLNSTGHVMNIRGGVLEVDGGGSPSTLTRNLGTTAGSINWRALTSFSNAGSGGFSAFNGNLTISLGTAVNPLLWGDSNTANGMPASTNHFIHGMMALIFGSTRSDSTVIWTNNIALDNGTTPLASSIREIRVIRGTGGVADRTQFTATISGSAATSLLKTGNGVLEFNSANTYAGNTLINGGRLLVTNTSGSGTGIGTVFVNNGGTLGGTGIIAGPVRVNTGGTVAPGTLAGPGQLTTEAAVTFSAGSTFDVRLNGTTAGSDYDQLVIGPSGSLTLNGATLSGLTGYTPGAGDRLFIVDNRSGQSSASMGTFAGLPQGATVTLGLFTAVISYQGNISTLALTGGNDIVLHNFQPVPEPSVVLLMCAAGAGLYRVVRRRR